MRLFLLLTALALLAGGCASNQPPTPAATSTPTFVPMPTPTVVPTWPPTEIPADGGAITPCKVSLERPFPERQRGFLEWSPDGSSLVFDVDDYTEQTIWEIGADGFYARKAAAPKPYTDDYSRYGFHAYLSPDGLRLVYSTCEYEKDAESLPRSLSPLPVYELAVVSMDGGEAQRLTGSSGADEFPAWSPDGSQIAYVGSTVAHHSPIRVAVWVMSVLSS